MEKFYIPAIKNIDNQYISIYNKNFRDNPEMTKMVGKIITKFIFKYKLNNEFYVYNNDASFGILPKFLNKKYAVQYLIDRHNPPFVIGAGDNVSDLDFMNLADFSLVPQKSTLNRIMSEYVRNSFLSK
jgi:hydroxymethylpyrimidine pyrophosphatase-like HAD family hydrolase